MVKADKVSSSSSPSKKTSSTYKECYQPLQDRLHTLLTRLSETSDLLKLWPESKSTAGGAHTNDSSIHVQTTTALLDALHKIVDGIKSVEEKVNNEALSSSQKGANGTTLPQKLKDSNVPLDLLELMDHGNGGLNPDCFARGLLRDSLRQLAGLQRRKGALQMLGAAIQSGITKREQEHKLQQLIEEEDRDKAMTEARELAAAVTVDDDDVDSENSRVGVDSNTKKEVEISETITIFQSHVQLE